jgi:hypothetical protein
MNLNYKSMDESESSFELQYDTYVAKVEHTNGEVTVIVMVEGLDFKLPCKNKWHAECVIKALQDKVDVSVTLPSKVSLRPGVAVTDTYNVLPVYNYLNYV